MKSSVAVVIILFSQFDADISLCFSDGVCAFFGFHDFETYELALPCILLT